LAVFEPSEVSVDEPNYIFVDLKNEQRARTQLRNFGTRRALEVSKLAIAKDIDPEKLKVNDQLLNRLIAKPFNSSMAGLLALDGSKAPSRGFLSALKQRLSI
jgi:hypothetical protein